MHLSADVMDIPIPTHVRPKLMELLPIPRELVIKNKGYSF
jgi:hypothetical protein